VSIVISARAQADIDIASEELAETYGLHIALAFQERLAETLLRLERQPLMAGVIDPPFPNYPDMRVRTVVKFKYRLVYYVPTDTGIKVVRILHAGMDSRAIFA
jgi:plasmid stabilization system protein ParE